MTLEDVLIAIKARRITLGEHALEEAAKDGLNVAEVLYLSRSERSSKTIQTTCRILASLFWGLRRRGDRFTRCGPIMKRTNGPC
jgi:hypothetical protein